MKTVFTNKRYVIEIKIFHQVHSMKVTFLVIICAGVKILKRTCKLP